MWPQLPGSLTRSIPATVAPRKTSRETSRPLVPGPGAVGDVAVLLQTIELAGEVVAHHLDARQLERVEAGGARAPGRRAGHFENGVEPVRHGPAALGIAPAPLMGQLPVPGPDAERQREGAHAVSGHGRVDGDQAPRDLLLHPGVRERGQVGVPERVRAELESLVRQEPELAEAPGRLLA